MKNLFSIALLAFVTVGIISCTKSKITNDGPFPVHPPVAPNRSLASNWLSMPFSQMYFDDGTIYLQADSIVDRVSNVQNFQRDNYVAFLYIKMEVAGQPTYSSVPFTIADNNENITIGYSLDEGILSIRIYNNSTSGQLLSADRFQDWQFRLVMVSAYDYQNHQIDWNDYAAVENALNHFQDEQLADE